MPTNDIHSHRCRSEQSSRAVLHLVVPRRSLCLPTLSLPIPAWEGARSTVWGWLGPRSHVSVGCRQGVVLAGRATRCGRP
jgi:hypothetical protein